MRKYRRKKWANWKRLSYTGPDGWERFVHKSRTGKKWYKTNFGMTSPYDSERYKWYAYDRKTGKFNGWIEKVIPNDWWK